MRRLALTACVVGLTVPASAQAIVGGHPASRAYPAMAELDIKDSFSCGATLVRADWILTAAHCVQDVAPEDLSFVLGKKVRSEAGGEEIKAAQILVNDKYQGGGHDVAVVHLARGATEQPAPVVAVSQSALWAGGKTATVIGWGATSLADALLGDSSSDELLEVQVPIQSDADCAQSYPFQWEGDTMMCAGDTEGGKDSCYGDSGGPLFVPDASNQLLVAGVVSFGTGCAVPTQYGVYSRVGDTELHAWLDQHLPAVAAPPSATRPVPGVNPAAAKPVKLRFSHSLGSAKSAAKSRRVKLRLVASGPVFSVRVSLSRSKSGHKVVVAKGSLKRLVGAAQLKMKLRTRPKAGALRVVVFAKDAQGRRVKASGSVRLKR